MGIGRMIVGVVAAAAAMAVAPIASASAADRFVSPSGSGTACTAAAPCGISTAFSGAVANDEITIGPGTYGTTASPVGVVLGDNGNFLTIHGQAGKPRPVIITNAMYGIQLTGGSSLSDVEVDDSAAGAWGIAVMYGMEATVSHVYVHTTGANAWACYPDGELVDSVCWDSGPGGGAARPLVILPANAVLINDTLIASGTGGVGAEVIGAGDANMTMSLTNTIVRGAGKDIYVTGEEVSPGLLTITADHSNYAVGEDDSTGNGTSMFTPVGSGTNQTAAPKFVDAATGNFHELGSSPTISHGTVNAVAGSGDLDGTPWELRTAPDIGAYEFVPAPTCAAKAVADTFQTATAFPVKCADSVGAALTYAITKVPSHGTATIVGSSGEIKYTPNAGFSGTDTIGFDATSANGTATPATASITVGQEPTPGMKAVHQTHSQWIERKPRHHTGKRPAVGTKFSFTLVEPATVTLAFTQRVHGHVVTRAKLTVNGKPGANTVKFNGKLGHGKKLKPGKYVVVITATDAGGQSPQVSLSFKIAR